MALTKERYVSRTQDLARASCTPAAACPAAHRRPESGTVAAPHGPAAVPAVQAAHPVPGPELWAPAVLPAGGGTARRRESGPLGSRQAPRASNHPQNSTERSFGDPGSYDA